MQGITDGMVNIWGMGNVVEGNRNKSKHRPPISSSRKKSVRR